MKKFIVPFVIVIFLASCASKKDVIYYQDIDETQLQDVSEIKPKVKIEMNDILQVNIKTANPESTIPFMKENIGVGSAMTFGNQPEALMLQGYIVDEYGEIQMPVIGKVQVEGLSRQQAEKKIKTKLSGYLIDPFVSVKFLNYKYTVQGEVNVPGTYLVFEPNLTLPQALGRAGDLTIRGRRDNILIIRTIGDERIVRRIDLTKSDWMNSPFYFIKQNDIIYVEPNSPRVKNSGFIPDANVVISAISITITIILSFILTN